MRAFDEIMSLVLCWGYAIAVIIFFQETWDDWFLWPVVAYLLLSPVVSLLIKNSENNEAKDEGDCNDEVPEGTILELLTVFIAFTCVFTATAKYMKTHMSFTQYFFGLFISLYLIIHIINRYTGVFGKIEKRIGINKTKEK